MKGIPLLLVLLAQGAATAAAGETAAPPATGVESTPTVEQAVPVEGASVEPDAASAEEAGGAVESAPAEAAPPTPPPPKDVVIVLDNSGSMKKNDPKFLTKVAVTDFINRLDAQTRVAVEVFDQDVRMTVPLTPVTDASRGEILVSLDRVNYKGLFTDSPAAVERAIYELKNNGRPDALKMVVFMTDGIVDTGNASVDVEKTRWLREDLAPAARDAGIRIFGIAFTEDADFQLIQSLAQNTSGEYFRALEAGDLGNVFEKINEIINRPPEPEPRPEEAKPTEAATPVPPPEPVVIHVPSPVPESVQAEDRVRSLIIMVAAIVLIGALVAVILLLVRRGRESRAPEQYVAEAYLKDLGGQSGQDQYRLGSRPTMIGRVAGKDTDHLDYVVIPQSTIGRRHALIEYKDFGYWIMDQGSINGTFVNDRPVTSEVRLKHGDRVRLHRYEFEFAMPEMDEAGMTVVSHTTYARQGGEPEGEVTVVKGGGGEIEPGLEAVFDIPGNEEAGKEGPGPEDETVLPESVGTPEDVTVAPGLDREKKKVSPAPAEEEDETLLPGGFFAAGEEGEEGGANDETLLPGAVPRGPAPGSVDAEDEDETLLPGSESPSGPRQSGKPRSGSGEDFFDITGADDERKD